jgi:hypothetical protein
VAAAAAINVYRRAAAAAIHVYPIASSSVAAAAILTEY